MVEQQANYPNSRHTKTAMLPAQPPVRASSHVGG
jgi:hypothetical protein